MLKKWNPLDASVFGLVVEDEEEEDEGQDPSKVVIELPALNEEQIAEFALLPDKYFDVVRQVVGRATETSHLIDNGAEKPFRLCPTSTLQLREEIRTLQESGTLILSLSP